MRLKKLVTFNGRKGPLLLVVADGVGIAPPSPANAVALANTPVIDALLTSALYTPLNAHGTWVGLPTDDDMGNSEVGHNALGSGQIINQGAKLVNQAFADNSIYDSAAWQQVEKIGSHNGTVHFLGLLSDGNVHSHIDHLLALIVRCDHQDIAKVRVHCLFDGRDVAPRSAPMYIDQLQTTLATINRKANRDYRIASGGGRMQITMDRYAADWDMVKRGYDLHVHGIGKHITDIHAEILRQYDSDDAVNDQTLLPFVVVDKDDIAVGTMHDGDAVVFYNFRGDRSIEISRALAQAEFDKFDRGAHPTVFYCGMLEYDGDLKLPTHYLVNPPSIDHTMIEYMCAHHIRTFAVSETQKFGHVTYFWNGNRSAPFDADLETWVEVPSDNIAFNKTPQMKAEEITVATIKLLQSGKFRFGRINYANGDMVGHTGDIAATVAAIEAVDRCLGRLIAVVKELDGILIFTADHGNADEMFVLKNAEQIARTSHTLNPVPFAIVDAANANDYRLVDNREQQFGLANVAATVFNLLGYHAPIGYQPSLIAMAHEPRSRRIIHQGAIVNLGLETVKLPNAEILALEIVRHPGGAVVIALNDANQVCLIRQFRHAAGAWIWEFPAGILEADEDIETTARRELKEETGCIAGAITALGSTLTTPGFCNERLHLFLAQDITLGEATPDQHEFIETHWMDIDTVNQMAASGEIDDAKTIVALFRLQQHLAANG